MGERSVHAEMQIPFQIGGDLVVSQGCLALTASAVVPGMTCCQTWMHLSMLAVSSWVMLVLGYQVVCIQKDTNEKGTQWKRQLCEQTNRLHL
jgi:hypothetical protein